MTHAINISSETLDSLAPSLTPEDRADMLARALDVCPDLSDYDVIAGHLHRHGFSLSQVATILDAAIDEARAGRASLSRHNGDGR